MLKKNILNLFGASLVLFNAVALAGPLADSPLSLKGSVPPNVLFTPSVEWPTAVVYAYKDPDLAGNKGPDGAAASSSVPADNYSAATEYLGYWDPNKCYTYDSTNGWFVPAAVATAHACSSQWSGNFMNWMSLTAIDIFRFAMTGGNRYQDTSTLTVLEVSYHDGQGGTTNFPTHTVNGATANGATPLGSVGPFYFRRQGLGSQMTYGITKLNVEGTSGLTVGNTTVNLRVKVCDTTIALEDNCRIFGTTWKPTGVVHDYSDRMKFGVFSYYLLSDPANTNTAMNTVMRSKLKYVGPTKFVAGSGWSGTNANQEWNAADGTLYVNPDPSETSAVAYANSGVVNYINKFGTTGSGSTRYKGYDVVGRLYYEAVNYLRARGPTSNPQTFSAGITSTNSDNFPAITNWDDPINFSCQKNFIIGIGDIYTHCDKRLPGSKFTTSACAGDAQTTSGALLGDTVNFWNWTDSISTLEGIAGTSLADRTTGSGGGVNGSYLWAGVAYWAHTQDIRPDDATKPWTLGKQTINKTYWIDVQEVVGSVSSQLTAAAQTTAGGGMAQYNPQTHYYFVTKYGSFNDVNNDGKPASASTWDANNDGIPDTYLKAGDPPLMIASVRQALADINSQIGVESALAQSSGDLRSGGGAYIYRALFNSSKWSGDVQAYSINSSGTISATPIWTAASLIAAFGSRKILTYHDARDATGAVASPFPSLGRQGVKFQYNQLSALQQRFLNKDFNGVDEGSTVGSARMDFVRGDTTNEFPSGYRWRNRGGFKMGDIVNSTPVFVGRPSDQIFESTYRTFASGITGRQPVVYVGGNDGMLHAFDAGTNAATYGTELLAYVPSSIFHKLSKLADPNYQHTYLVDGSPTAAEACFGACSASGNWKTILVGGMNAGGRGIYALDITNPTNFTLPADGSASSVVLWEFTAKDDTDLGYTFGRPLVRKMNNGKWAVLFGSGWNNTTASGPVGGPSDTASSNGRAYLYIVFVDGPTGANRTWISGTDYIKIDTGVGSTGTPNGIGNISAVDRDGDGKIDFIYAGDRAGKVYKFDLTSTTASTWAAPTVLFSAVDGSGTVQPITSGLEITIHPRGGYLITFGTGSFVEQGDPAVLSAETAYGIWDKLDGSTVSGRSALQKQILLGTATVGGTLFYAMSDCKPNWGPGNADPRQPSTDTVGCPSSIGGGTPVSPQRGWFFDMPNAGERMVAERPLLQSGVVTFATLEPADDPCTGNTVGRRYDLDVFTGGAVTQGIIDINGDGVINTSDKITVGGVAMYASGKQLVGGASDVPLRFQLNPVGYTPPSSSSSSSSSSSGACGNFIPGWGCPGSYAGQRQRALDVISSEFLATGGGSQLTGTSLLLPGSSSRLGWRQIFTR
jgi:type IV pilus assembly protein PilY1